MQGNSFRGWIEFFGNINMQWCACGSVYFSRTAQSLWMSCQRLYVTMTFFYCMYRSTFDIPHQQWRYDTAYQHI